ncbi:MAG: FAD-dependent oxidoreductase [Planctomyces sp.]
MTGFVVQAGLLVAAWAAGLMAGSTPAAEARKQADVVIYGATSAGVAAAVQVSRMGHSVILIEPGQHVGGLTSGGLGFTDSGDKRAIGGISREFYQRIRKHYDNSSAWTQERPQNYPRYRPADDAMWTFEPKVAEQVFRQMLTEARVELLHGEQLNRSSGVTVADNQIQQIVMESGLVLAGQQFIDATYEGDLMAAAKVKYTIGREANSVYGETLNGNQVRANTHNHRFLKPVDPFRVPGDRSSGLLPGIEDAGAGIEGSGDHRVQAYCFRMCMSKSPANRRPFPKPEGYDEQVYELLLRNFEAGDLRVPLSPDMMPNLKTDTNNNCAVSTDYLGGNYRYPEADYAERAAIIRDHETYQKGLMWTLANHPRVPASVRSEMAQWGLPLDEFTDNDNWPHQLYIREARRMVSDYVMIEQDCRRERMAQDSVGLGSYNMDSHNVRRFVTAEGTVQNEGDVQVSPGGAYLISYRSVVPAKGQVENLAVPVCLAASHIAYGSIRMEPVFMVLGQSVATAAVMALESKCSLQDVPYPSLRARLLRDGQVLDLPAAIPPKILISRDSLPGLVLDDGDAELQGEWRGSSSAGRYVGAGYLHDGDLDKGKKSATWKLTVPSSGTWRVGISYSAASNRATAVPVQVQAGDGVEQQFEVNQRKAIAGDAVFHELTRVTLAAGQTVRVTISNAGTDGHVIVDAVQVEKVE